MPDKDTIYDLGKIRGEWTKDRLKAEALAEKRAREEQEYIERYKRFKKSTETFKWDVKGMTLGSIAENAK